MKEERKNATTNSADGSASEKTLPTIENDTRVQSIVSAHRDEALMMFVADSPASKIISLRTKNLSAIKSPALPPAALSTLEELLLKSEEEAMKLFQMLRSHRDATLKMLESDAPASRMVALRLEILSSMKSAVGGHPAPPSALQELLGRSEKEAMAAFNGRRQDHDNKDRDHDGLCGTSRTATPDREPYCHIVTNLTRGDSPRKPRFVREQDEILKRKEVKKEDNDSGDDMTMRSRKGIPVKRNGPEVEQLVSRIRNPADLGAGNFDESCSAKEFSELSGAELKEDDAIFKSLKGGYLQLQSGSKRYQSSINIRGKRLYLGTYKLRSDAAFAYDLAGRVLGGREWDKANFATEKDHVDVREKEMRLAGINVDLKGTLATISTNVKKAAPKVGIDRSQDGDDCVSDDDGSTDSDDNPGYDIPLKGNGSARNSRPPNGIANSPRKQTVVRKQDATFQRKEFEKEGNDSEDDVMLKSWKGIVGKCSGNYHAGLSYKGKAYKIGAYKLRADAALAYDEASKALGRHGKANFSTETNHICMREKEMKSNGRKVDLEEPLATISAEVERLVSTIKARSELTGVDFDESCNAKECSERPSEGVELEQGDAVFKSLKGCYRLPGAKGYKSVICIRGNRLYLGSFRLQSDAAFAYDLAGRTLGGPEWGPKWDKANFRTKTDHADMREKEMRSAGINVDLKGTLATISTNLEKAVLKVGAGHDQDDGDCVSDDGGSSASIIHDQPNCEGRGETATPTAKVLRWVFRMPTHVQRRHIAAGLRVKVRFEDNVWYGGVVQWVIQGIRQGRRIKISFDDGTEEMTDFPDNDVIVDDVGNGEHRGDASAFAPAVDASFDESCNPRDGSASSITEELVTTKSSVHGLESNIWPPNDDVPIDRSSERSLSASQVDSERTKAAAFEKKDVRVFSGDQTRQPENALISVEEKHGLLSQELICPNKTSSDNSPRLLDVSNSPRKRKANQEQAKVSRLRHILITPSIPDNDVIVDNVRNGGHHGDASVFFPAVDVSFDQGCNLRDGLGSSITEEMVATKSNANGLESNIYRPDEDVFMGRSSEGSVSASHDNSETDESCGF